MTSTEVGNNHEKDTAAGHSNNYSDSNRNAHDSYSNRQYTNDGRYNDRGGYGSQGNQRYGNQSRNDYDDNSRYARQGLSNSYRKPYNRDDGYSSRGDNRMSRHNDYSRGPSERSHNDYSSSGLNDYGNTDNDISATFTRNVDEDNDNDNQNDINEYEEDESFRVTKFDDLGLKKQLLRGIFSYGFEKPSKIQQKAILPIIRGFDIIGQAQSGTGKTGTFVIATLQIINEELFVPQAILLSPTRELATQTCRVVVSLGDNLGIRCHVCIGGTNVTGDMQALNHGAQVICGTPGRILDMMTKEKNHEQEVLKQRALRENPDRLLEDTDCYLNVKNLRIVVLDEADEILSRGFKKQLYGILIRLSKDVIIALFSATMPNDIIELSKKFMKKNLKRILIQNEQLTLDGIKQYYALVENEAAKFHTLTDLYESIEIQACIIYVNSRYGAEKLAAQMTEDCHSVSCIHGKLLQRDRDIIMEQFRSGSSRVLITTDLLSRGIDVQQVSIVINYDLPISLESYIHRIGRSGRFGKKGVAINFVTHADYPQLKQIEAFYSTQIECIKSFIDSSK